MPKRVALFVPCLVDQLYPEIAVSLVNILEHFDYEVSYNSDVVCCGQPAFNAGHLAEARAVSAQFLRAFPSDVDVVCPSGSCTGMVRCFTAELFHEESEERKIATSLSTRVFEFSEFLARENLIPKLSGSFPGKIAFHNSCHSARELKITTPVRDILARISGYEDLSPRGEPVCCGFGGLFSVKFNNIAEGMAKSRLEQLCDSGADTVVSNDPGCIMHMRQEAEREKRSISIIHFTEFLARAMKLPLTLS